MVLFLKVMAAEFVAEMGDKTQFMLIAMTSKYRIRDIIIGTAIAILVLNGMAVLAGGLVGSVIPQWLMKIVAAIAFLIFALMSLTGNDDAEEEAKAAAFRFAPVAIFLTFVLAELGDKTQLTAITFGANEGIRNGLIVWMACSVGLFAADIIGLVAGYFLSSKIPARAMNVLAALIFAVFGIVTMRTGLMLFPAVGDGMVRPILILVSVIFVLVCGMVLIRQRKRGRCEEK